MTVVVVVVDDSCRSCVAVAVVRSQDVPKDTTKPKAQRISPGKKRRIRRDRREINETSECKHCAPLA